jgi:RNA ligase
MIHPAKEMPYADLLTGLRAEVASGNVHERTDGAGLSQFTYSDQCVYERRWNQFSLIARGLILDINSEKTAALVFPKFFNLGEGITNIPDLPFETLEKLDGSLIIIWSHNGIWRTATKGSFNSAQSRWASEQLTNLVTSRLDTGTTYLCEAIYPANRIVVRYDYEALVLLGAYAADGREFLYDDLKLVSNATGWRIAKRHHYANVADLIALAGTLPSTEEGFVLRFADGLRLKLKGDEYCRIHRLVSDLTPLAIWNAMLAEDDLSAVRKDLPEEFWGDFDQIHGLLTKSACDLMNKIAGVASKTLGMTDKEVGLALNSYPEDVRSFIFPWRKAKALSAKSMLDGRTRRHFFDQFRPDANNLEGYRPSTSINQVFEEAA